MNNRAKPNEVVCVCATVAHPQSSTVIIYSDRCPHNKLHGSYVFITDCKVQLYIHS